MIVRNWMKRDPITVTSDTLVSKAKRILVEQNLRALPVVDNGRLRGVITRVSCLRAAEFVTRTEDPHEFSYFANRLKVKDLMVRNPHTVSVDDTMDDCLRRGQAENVSQFPVVDKGNVVGLVSASEIFYLAGKILGLGRQWGGLTIGPLSIERGTLRHIGELIEETGATLESLFTTGREDEEGRTKVVARFTGVAAETVAAAVTAAKLPVIEICPDEPSNTNASK